MKLKFLAPTERDSELGTTVSWDLTNNEKGWDIIKKNFQLVQDFFHRYSQPSPRMWHCSGATPLMHAIVAGSFEQAAVLIAYGASLEAKNYRGCTVPRRRGGQRGWKTDGNRMGMWKYGKNIQRNYGKHVNFANFRRKTSG